MNFFNLYMYFFLQVYFLWYILLTFCPKQKKIVFWQNSLALHIYYSSIFWMAWFYRLCDTFSPILLFHIFILSCCIKSVFIYWHIHIVSDDKFHFLIINFSCLAFRKMFNPLILLNLLVYEVLFRDYSSSNSFKWH